MPIKARMFYAALFGLLIFFAVMAVWETRVSAKPAPAFYTYAPIRSECVPHGEGHTCNVYVETDAGLDMELNAYVAQNGLMLVGVVDGVAVLSTP